MALFLRYCAACNRTQSVVANRGKCEGCGATLDTHDAGALIPALGRKLDIGQRTGAADDLHLTNRK